MGVLKSRLIMAVIFLTTNLTGCRYANPERKHSNPLDPLYEGVNENNNQQNNNKPAEVGLDQSQTDFSTTLMKLWTDRDFNDPERPILVAQSFVPSTSRLTKIKVNFRPEYSTNRFTLLISTSFPADPVLTKVTFATEDTIENQWWTFDFPDISVNIGQTYMFILYGNDIYSSAYIRGSSGNAYTKGNAQKVFGAFMSDSDGNLTVRFSLVDLMGDLAFKTYSQ